MAFMGSYNWMVAAHLVQEDLLTTCCCLQIVAALPDIACWLSSVSLSLQALQPRRAIRAFTKLCFPQSLCLYDSMIVTQAW